jgi:hypothetical protein
MWSWCMNAIHERAALASVQASIYDGSMSTRNPGDPSEDPLDVEQGVAKGQHELLLGLLEERFGALPAAVTRRVARGNLQDLERWSKRILKAASLDDIFAASRRDPRARPTPRAPRRRRSAGWAPATPAGRRPRTGVRRSVSVWPLVTGRALAAPMKHRSFPHGRAWARRARWPEAEDGRGGPRRDSRRRGRTGGPRRDSRRRGRTGGPRRACRLSAQ